MLRDVRSNVTDGLLGFATATGDGLHIKIGVSPSVTEKPITILGSMGASTIKSKLGLSPLADAVMDAVQGGAARVFCIPVAASTAGTIGEVTKTGDGGGSVTVQGSPNNAYALTVRFTAQGGLNTAAFVYSIDGDNFSDEITVPVTGSYEIEGTGLTIKFTEASSPDQKPSSFLVRDTYTLKTTAPSMTNGDVLGAIEKIKSFSEEFEFVHIVGESTVELWEAVSEAQKELMTVCHKPCFFLMEAAYPADEADGDLSDWALKMEADRKRIKNSDIQVCAAWGRLVRLDGTTQIVNLAGLASGRYAMTKVSVSIGKTKDEDALGFPKTKLLELVPIGYDSTVIELLDVAGYMTFREYDGLDDIFVYHTKMMCKDGSDFRYEDAVGWSAIEAGYKTALRGSRKFTREAVLYDLYSEVNNVRLWRDLKKIEKTRQAGVSEYTPGKYRHRIIVEPKERSLHIPPLRDKIVQLVIHQELQTLFRPVFVNRSFACMYGKGPIRAAFNVQHDMRVARMKWGDEATVIKIDVRKFFYSIDRSVLKQIIAKRFKKLKKKYPEKYEDFLRFYRLLCKVIDSSPEGERGIPLGNVSSQDFANIYLNELDQFCIRFLGATLYTRYMDDVVVIAPNKEIAREWLAKIKVFLQERLHLETNQKTKIFYVRQGVNAYGFKIKATHLLLRTESKRREKRRIKRMMEKLQEGTITKAAIVQSVNSWLGFARWACAYNLAKKIFAPYRFIKTEGELPYGAISRNRQARRILQQRRGAGKTHKAVA